MEHEPIEHVKDPESITYWEEYYRANPHPFNPSAFAMEMAKRMGTAGPVIELGCGNGRDAVFLGAQSKGPVVAIDQCEEETRRLNAEHGNKNLQFVAGDFSRYTPTTAPRYIYSRWTMHAVDEVTEDRTLDWVAAALVPGGEFMVEARSIRDDLYGKGESLGGHAFFTDHYRRFMDPERFAQKLRNRGLEIISLVESRGLAVHKQDDPMIVRVLARKP
ncbi:MAG: class I SAM-dependent methyltransferase [Bacteroidetes bacterium]|nr:class I SAM-dependent methyltransferase [Bacteroidota bacterium]MBX7129752.1 class I SAM-dependent methyltransferase [Flavobacteriales bacterium]MCC6654103.1 class I SAM-dependent methyltransferase [Flavobacteriales bacterium]HMU13461.1 class I SAM-dependent methyltransferase [Flavobacteriales bacterium]HMZ48372.1 class I SAM-dependent methyltransferase [Flavobacteriales bacterium]